MGGDNEFLTEDEDRVILKEEHGLPLTEEEKKLLKRAIKKFTNDILPNKSD